ncbi:protein SKIP34 isoform X3 [Malania oleifera]|uniref:protein SKIP34 isoform X1 n=1 Tax=Malania oleifera TaxID=397392 RepID=UPI0025AE9539|nr:protein SKIP34 isoform X1 [Malania oleifera]XP_057961842.1 protein SKIP34 isoform X2 [Malania oleifera]XP_057961851.1 protein SKIP34 isoform X3 [Malania oleifera]
MCYHHHLQTSWNGEQSPPRAARAAESDAVVEDLRARLAETEARLEGARAREAELSRQLEEMKRFVSVMEILENYLKVRFQEQKEHVTRLFSRVPK